MRQNDRRRRLFKTFTACLLALAMLLSNVGAMDVWAANVKKPSINLVKIGAKEVTGGGLVGSGQRRRVNKDCFIHVTVKNDKGSEVETKKFSIGPTERGSTWSVTLDNALQKDWTVIAKQEFNGDFSDEATITVKQLLAEQYAGKLTMPALEVSSEDIHVLESDAVEDIVKAFTDKNNELANVDGKNFEGNLYKPKNASDKTKAIDVSGNGESITVTFSDGSKIENIPTNVTVKQITKASNPAEVEKLTVVDGEIKGKISGDGPFKRARVTIVKFNNEGSKNNYCNSGNCAVDKNAKELATIFVDETTGKFTYQVTDNELLTLGKDIGITVKEYRKKNNCKTIQPSLVIPNVPVRDPKKVTKEEKDKIREEIRKANTVKGTSKLPDGTGENKGILAVIQVDVQGNVKVISGNYVEVNHWDNDGNPIPETNPDGSDKLKEGTSPAMTAEPKEVLSNLPPKAPKVELSDDNEKITVTPDAADTDAKEVSVTYKGKDDRDKKTVAKKENGTWKITEGEGSVDANGVITLPADQVKGGTKVNASVTDDGFAVNNQNPATSEQGAFTLKTKADQVTELGGLSAVDLKKWVGDEPNWKDGVKAKEDDKKDAVNKLLEKATFEDATDTARTTAKSGTFEGKIKVKFSDGSELVVENQKLMVCDHVTSTTDPKLPDDAIEVQMKLGEGVKVEDKDPNSGAVTKTTEGNKDNPATYKTYRVKPNTNLATYTHPTLQKTIFDLIDETAQDHYADPAWKDSKDGQDFVVTTSNDVFTATATQTFEVKVVPNGGTGDDKVTTVKKDGTYTLPAKDTFQPPNENQEFSGWQVGTDAKLKNPGETIAITANTEVKAIWKPIEYKVSFKAGDGASGEMTDVTVTKGSDYQLPVPTFNVPENKQFAGWKVNDEAGVKGVGQKIPISGNVTLTATWKAIPVEIAFDKGDGSGTMAKATVDKGSMYKLPESKFTPPAGKVFAGWMINGAKEVTAAGTEIKIAGPIKLTAVYKDAPKSGKGSGFWFVPAPAEPEKEIGRHDRYLYGYEDKRVRPEGNITRAEAAALIARLAELDMSDKSKPNFVDTPSAWYNSAINIMVKKDLMFGDKNGNFRPAEPITRGEFARALLYIDATNDKVAPFADVKGHEFEAAINQAYGNNRISGYPDGTFRPDAPIQRAEAARILNQYANRGTTLEGMAPVAKDLIQFTDINPSHWAYCEVMEAANTHEYERVKGTQAETWLRILHDEMKR